MVLAFPDPERPFKIPRFSLLLSFSGGPSDRTPGGMVLDVANHSEDKLKSLVFLCFFLFPAVLATVHLGRYGP